MRNLDTRVEEKVITPFIAVDLEFDSGDVYLWNGVGQLNANGNTYLGAGNLLGFSQVEETSEIAARGMSLQLSGLNSSILSLALNEPYQNRPCNVWFGLIAVPSYLLTESYEGIDYESSENVLLFDIDDIYTIELFSGIIDTMTISEDGTQTTVALNVESKMIDLERPRVSRYTSEDQKLRFPNDRGLEFVTDIQDKEILWGG